MYKEVLQAMEGVGIWPTVSLLLFMAAFALMLYRVIRMDKEEIRHAEQLPLEGNSPASTSLAQDSEVS